MFLFRWLTALGNQSENEAGADDDLDDERGHVRSLVLAHQVVTLLEDLEVTVSLPSGRTGQVSMSKMSSVADLKVAALHLNG